MDNKVKYIEVVFENCESISIPFYRVKRLEFSPVTNLDAEFFEGNSYLCDWLNLDISYEEEWELKYNDMAYDEPLGMYAGNPTSNSVEDRPNILGRLLNHEDVVFIELQDAERIRINSIYVPWSEENEYSNRYMTTEIEDKLIKLSFYK